MDAVIALHPGRADATVSRLVQTAGFALVPLFPQATDTDGQRWFLLQADAAQAPALQGLLVRLQTHPDVDAAYLKSEGEAPGH